MWNLKKDADIEGRGELHSMANGNQSKEKWNKKYRERLTDFTEPKPNARLINLSAQLYGGKALDLACGLGGNSLFLAEQGYEVDATDISETAIEYVRKVAEKKRVKVNAFVNDLTDIESLPFKKDAYDAVLITYYLDRQLFPYVKGLLKEGGLFFMETYCDSPIVEGGKVSERFQLKPKSWWRNSGSGKSFSLKKVNRKGGKPFFAGNLVCYDEGSTYWEDGWNGRKVEAWKDGFVGESDWNGDQCCRRA